jgi:RNA polymerase sigma-70 factor (ECF subfamily)
MTRKQKHRHMTADPDLECIQGCLYGDRACREVFFEKLFRKYEDRVYSTALRITGDPALAHDAAQETFLTVFQKLDTFQQHAKFSSWLYRIAVNCSISKTRKTSKEPPVVSEDVGVGSTDHPPRTIVDPGSVDPEKLASSKEFESKIQEVVERLSEPLRVVVVLRYSNGLSYKEISQVIGCSVGTVKSRLNRAMRALEPMILPILEKERP